MVYRINRDPIIDNDRVLRVDRMRVGSHSQLSSSHMQGTTSGYNSSGLDPVVTVDTIEKFSLSSDANASDVGDLTQVRQQLCGQSSSSNGYTSGGYVTPTFTAGNVIDKFPFSSDDNATDVGDLLSAMYRLGGHSSTSHGYTSGGIPPYSVDTIQKFAFASDGNAIDVGDLTEPKSQHTACSSTTHGYSAGGTTGFQATMVIEKFPFSSDNNATSVGNLINGWSNQNSGISSDISGYLSGVGQDIYTISSDVFKFSFTVDGDTTSSVGDLSQSRQGGGGQNSTVSGYVSGGVAPPPPSNRSNVIDKFPFSSDGNAADVGDLTESKMYTAGQQV